jgi:hypothetical protein
MLTYITDRNPGSSEDLTDAKDFMATINDDIEDMFYDREIKQCFAEKPYTKPIPKVDLIM